MIPRNAELYTVAHDEIVVTFSTDVGVEVTTSVGDHEVTTVGPYHHVTVGGLSPAHEYSLRVSGVAPDAYLPATVTTLAEPSGKLLCRFATVNDVHFGEQICGLIGGESAVGPVFTRSPRDEAYPDVMNRSVIADIERTKLDSVLVKGDLTSSGTTEQYQAFLDAYGTFGDRLHHIRGNHESYNSEVVANVGSKVVELPGVTAVMLDTSRYEHPNGVVTRAQLAWLDNVFTGAPNPVLVFGHHQLWDATTDPRTDKFFGVIPECTEQLLELFARHDRVAGYFAGHTHCNRVVRNPAVRNIPIVEVASTKEYPGAWAEYRIYEGGYLQIGRCTSGSDAMGWADRTRDLYAGLYRNFALGKLADRCFVETW